MLPAALAVLSGCVLPQGCALQKFGAQRAELEGLRAELGAERAESRARADVAIGRLRGALELLERAEQVVATRVRAEQPWNGDPNVTSSLHASLMQTVEANAAANGITSDSAADMKRRLEDKIAALTAKESEQERNSKEDARAGELAEADWRVWELTHAEWEDVDKLVAMARQAGKARLEEAKRNAKEQLDRWQMEQARAKEERLRAWRIERRKDVLAKLEAEDARSRMMAV